MRRVVLILLSAWCASAALPTLVVTVTNTTTAVNGNTASLYSLMNGDGGDGISLREAIAAANNTPGPKRIVFAAALKSETIPVGSTDPQEFFPMTLSSGGLEIDGDIDGDTMPDVTLSGTGREYGTSIDIRSSNVTLNGLVLHDFAGTAITFACQDQDCFPRTISNIRITNCRIESTRGSGIEIGVWGMMSYANAAFLSNITFENITIANNTIRVRNAGIGVRPSVGGASANRALHVTITNNRITADNGIDVGAADESSNLYSDHSLIEDLVIDSNVIEDSKTGLDVYGANLGNQHATVRRVRIANNRIVRSVYTGMYLISAGNPLGPRATAFNTIEDLVVEGNEIDGGGFGILLSSGDLPTTQSNTGPIEDNAMRGVLVSGNVFRNYRRVALSITGGAANPGAGLNVTARNTLHTATVTGNQFDGTSNTTAIEIAGGDSTGGASATDNAIGAVVISENTFRGNGHALSILGGRGTGARRNEVSATLKHNTFDGNTENLHVVDDDGGAFANAVHLSSLRRRAARH